MILTDLQYLPCLEFFCRILREDTIILEAHENFPKQTYRNRTYILGANGVHMLNIPVVKGRSKTQIRDLQIDNRQAWQTIHWRSVLSAYNNAPFFEYYRPFLEKEFHKREKYLWDFNVRLLTICLELLGLNDKMIKESEAFAKHPDGDLTDLRSVIHPKVPFRERSFYRPVPYIQVFGKDFVPNLSIIDLLCCQGPEARRILNESARV